MDVVYQEAKKFRLLAEKFKDAAILCLSRGILQPGAFLVSFSIELYLKTFLFLKYAPIKKGKTYEALKKISPKHSLKLILDECIRYDNNFKKLKTLILRYEKYPLLRYPDGIKEIIYHKGGYEFDSSQFINNLEEIKQFILEFIPEEVKS